MKIFHIFASNLVKNLIAKVIKKLTQQNQKSINMNYTTKEINSTFKIKVAGRTDDGVKVNTLVGVSGAIAETSAKRCSANC